MKSIYSLLRTRRLWCAVVLLLCALGSSAKFNIYHYPATTNTKAPYVAYGGVGYGGVTATSSPDQVIIKSPSKATASGYFLALNQTSSLSSQYVTASEYAEAGAKGTDPNFNTYYPAYFIGFAFSDPASKAKNFTPDDSGVYITYAHSYGRRGTGDTYTNTIPFSGYWVSTEKHSDADGDAWCCFTMIKQEAAYQLSEGETEVPAKYGTVSRNITCVAVTDKVTLTASKETGYEIVGWRIKEQYDEATGTKKTNYPGGIIPGTEKAETFEVGAGTDYPISERTIYEAVFKQKEQSTGNYVHAQVTAYPTANVNLGMVAYDADGSTTASDITAATAATSANNTEKGLHFFAKEGQGHFLGFASGKTNAQIEKYIEADDAIKITDYENGVYELSGLTLDPSNKDDDNSYDLNDIYAVFTMLKASAISSNGTDLSDNTNITIVNTTEGYKDITAIGYGQNAKLTAVALSTNYSLLGWRVKGTNTYLPANADGTLSLTDVKEAAEYEAVFDSKCEIYISEASELDGKYWATVGNCSDQNMSFDDRLTAYIICFDDNVDASDIEIVTKSTTNYSSSPTDIPAYTIEKVYADEDARTISLASNAGIQLSLNEIGDKGVNHTALNFRKDASGWISYYYVDIVYSTGGSKTLGYTNTNFTTRATTNHTESATNRQAVLVCADAPGLYTLSYTNRVIANTTNATETVKTYGINTWPRYNRLSARDEAFTPDLTSYDYYVLSKKNGRVAFYPVKEGREIPAGKGYIRVAKGATSETKEYIDFLPNGGTVTGIRSVNVENNDVNAPVYNLAGQRVGNDYKGIVIVNGKKYVRK